MLVLGVAYFLVILDKWDAVLRSKGARDYATYHYALKTSWEGDNPYRTKNLNKRAQKEGFRRTVHPYFYPPPSLLPVIWTKPLSLMSGYRIFFWLNQFLFILTLYNIWRWLRTPVWFLGLLAVSFTPVADTLKMGQANIFILWLLSIVLSRSSGGALALAAMTKMAPALLFFQWCCQKKWMAIRNCLFGILGLSTIACSLISIEDQWFFYTVVLPQFSSGAYHGLSIPINLPANHSIPDLYNQLWPGESQHKLSVTASFVTSVTNGLLLAIVLICSFLWKNKSSQRFLQGGMICLMLIFPVYCYEHHLALLVLPFVILWDELRRQKYPYIATALFFVMYALAAWPLFMLRTVQKWIPSMFWMLQESKFFAITACLLCCVFFSYKHHRLDST